jgi:hypothetical protein
MLGVFTVISNGFNQRRNPPNHGLKPRGLRRVQSVNGDTQPATTYLGDLEIFEQMLHSRLFGLPCIEPTVFHRAGS